MVSELIHATDIALKDELHTRESLAAAVALISRQPGLEERLMGSWGPFLKPSARLGHVLFAPNEAQHVRFTHPITWLPLIEDVDPIEGLRIILRQFMHTYGPVNRREFMRWFGVARASLADRMLATISDETVELQIIGEPKPHLVLAADVDEIVEARPTETVRLLPGFDQYVVNSPRGVQAILRQDRTAEIYRAQGWISATIVVGGRIEGIWKHDVESDHLLLEISPFAPLDARVTRQIETEAERLAGYFGRPLIVQWS